MKLRQLLSWRFSLIFFHRWLGIVVGLMFVIWSLSGVVLMYAGIPHLSAGERLFRLQALDLSTVAITPQQALEKTGGSPFRLRISMQNGRPAYRINTGVVFGQWTVVYADTGEVMPAMTREAAINWLAATYPEATALQYETLLESPDLYTHSPALQTHMPLHRIAMQDGSRYYIAANTGESVMKTTPLSRVLGNLGYNVHTLYWFRQAAWWTPFLHWVSWIGLVMTILGVVLGIWRFSLRPQHIKRGIAYRTPYSGWWKWHHYAGLLFGVLMLSWVSSGVISMSLIPGITESFYTPAQIKAGARTVQGYGATTDYAPLSIAGMQHAVTKINQSFPVKELELIYFNEQPYYIAYAAPDTPQEVDDWHARSALDFITPMLETRHQVISATTASQSAFTAFSEAQLLQAAATAMPGMQYSAMDWLTEHDDYYYHTVDSFDLGLPRTVRTLPVLRLKYDDPQQTWLYLTPSHGQVIKAETSDRLNRWGYYGLHGFDFAALWNSRPLWDILVLFFLAGCITMSVTTLVPAFERLKRHTLRLLSSGRK